MSRIPRRPKRPTPAQRKLWLGISRINQPDNGTVGWFVRVGFQTADDGTYQPRRTKYFGDATHGGPHASLRAARKWRDEQLTRPRRRRKVISRS